MRGKLILLSLIIIFAGAVLAFEGAFGPLPQGGSKPVEVTAKEKIPLIGVTAPAIRWKEEAKPGDKGRVRLSFRVEASSPLSSLQLQISAINPQTTGMKVEKELREIPTWMLGNKALDWDGEIDLTGSLLAGQPVLLQILASDEDKRSSTSESVKVTLPEHRFSQPLSQALYQLRKGLQDDPSSRRNEALRALAGLLQQRGNFQNSDLTLLTLRSAAVRIALDGSDEGLQSALDLLWHAALLFEENPSANANVALSLKMSPKPTVKPE